MPETSMSWGVDVWPFPSGDLCIEDCSWMGRPLTLDTIPKREITRTMNRIDVD